MILSRPSFGSPGVIVAREFGGTVLAMQAAAFSSEVDAGSRQENASEQRIWSAALIQSEPHSSAGRPVPTPAKAESTPAPRAPPAHKVSGGSRSPRRKRRPRSRIAERKS